MEIKSKGMLLVKIVLVELVVLAVIIPVLVFVNIIAGVVLLLIDMIALSWVIKSIRIVGPDQLAVIIKWGDAVKAVSSGWYFVPWFRSFGLVKFPTTRFNLDYLAKKVITKAGLFIVPPDDPTNPEDKGRSYYCGAQEVTVDAEGYLKFPDPRDLLPDPNDTLEEAAEKKDRLIKILRAKIPTTEAELMKWTDGTVIGALRVVAGRKTWRHLGSDLEDATFQATELFRKEDGILYQAGFWREDLSLNVKEVHLPKALSDKLVYVDAQALEAEASEHEARQRAVETIGALIEMIHEAEGRPKEEIQSELKQDPEAFYEKHEAIIDVLHRTMAIRGKSYLDIRSANAFMDLAAFWQRMPMGSSNEDSTSPKAEKTTKKKKKSTVTFGGQPFELNVSGEED